MKKKIKRFLVKGNICNQDNRKNAGITLVALVITIVVLIILAAVTINLTLGNNGIFNRAKTAKEQYQNAQDYEEAEIAKYSNEIDVMSGRNTLSSQVVLYESSNPTFTTGNITLNQDIDKYNRFTVYCYLGDTNRSKYFEVYEKGKNVLLDGQYKSGNSYFRDASIELTFPTTGKIATISNAALDQNGGYFDQTHIAIYKIVGYVD